jgi:hypothetical protein
MDRGDERREKLDINKLKELMKNSTNVVNWYPYMETNGATVRGPWSRWFRVDDVDYGKEHVSSALDDAKYAAAAMNSMPALLALLDDLGEFVKAYENQKGLDNDAHEIEMFKAYTKVRKHETR